MAEHAGQKRAVVQFLKHGKKVDEHRAKGRETASDDPEDAHEVQGGIDHNIPMTIFHCEDAGGFGFGFGATALGGARYNSSKRGEQRKVEETDGI